MTTLKDPWSSTFRDLSLSPSPVPSDGGDDNGLYNDENDPSTSVPTHPHPHLPSQARPRRNGTDSIDQAQDPKLDRDDHGPEHGRGPRFITFSTGYDDDLDLSKREDHAVFTETPFTLSRLRAKKRDEAKASKGGRKDKPRRPIMLAGDLAAKNKTLQRQQLGEEGPPSVEEGEEGDVARGGGKSTIRKTWTAPVWKPSNGWQDASGREIPTHLDDPGSSYTPQPSSSVKGKYKAKATAPEGKALPKPKASPAKKTPKQTKKKVASSSATKTGKKAVTDKIEFRMIPANAKPNKDFPILESLERQRNLPPRPVRAYKSASLAGARSKFLSLSPSPDDDFEIIDTDGLVDGMGEVAGPSTKAGPGGTREIATTRKLDEIHVGNVEDVEDPQNHEHDFGRPDLVYTDTTQPTSPLPLTPPPSSLPLEINLSPDSPTHELPPHSRHSPLATHPHTSHTSYTSHTSHNQPSHGHTSYAHHPHHPHHPHHSRSSHTFHREIELTQRAIHHPKPSRYHAGVGGLEAQAARETMRMPPKPRPQHLNLSSFAHTTIPSEDDEWSTESKPKRSRPSLTLTSRATKSAGGFRMARLFDVPTLHVSQLPQASAPTILSPTPTRPQALNLSLWKPSAPLVSPLPSTSGPRAPTDNTAQRTYTDKSTYVPKSMRALHAARSELGPHTNTGRSSARSLQRTATMVQTAPAAEEDDDWTAEWTKNTRGNRMVTSQY